MRMLFFVLLVGCGDGLRSFDELSDPSDDRALRDCRNVGRALGDAGAPPARVYAAYVDCTREAGLR